MKTLVLLAHFSQRAAAQDERPRRFIGRASRRDNGCKHKEIVVEPLAGVTVFQATPKRVLDGSFPVLLVPFKLQLPDEKARQIVGASQIFPLEKNLAKLFGVQVRRTQSQEAAGL